LSGPGRALHLFVRAGGWLLAVSARDVERIALGEDVAWVERRSLAARDGHLGSLAVGSVCYSAWDLGLMFGLGAVDAAWVLLRLPGGEAPLPVALRVGTCVRVAPLPGLLTALPAAVFRRRRAVAGAFFEGGTAGLALDTALLWSDEERAEAEEIRSRASALAALRQASA
jgi:hypothetical protein